VSNRGFADGTNAIIGVIATDAVLTKAQAQKISQMAYDSLTRSINPVHTMSDGDTLLALGTRKSGKTGNPNLLGMLIRRIACAMPLNPARQDLLAIQSFNDPVRCASPRRAPPW
jgi:L-aminopeptidase/D-esterase-like protein